MNIFNLKLFVQVPDLAFKQELMASVTKFCKNEMKGLVSMQRGLSLFILFLMRERMNKDKKEKQEEIRQADKKLLGKLSDATEYFYSENNKGE